MTAQTESLLGGRYRLESRIATGGMGQVWRARDEVLGRPVAVKVLRPEYADDQTFSERFRAEARNTAALSHLGIAQVYDFGQAELGAGPSRSTVAYIVMELVPGEPLSRIIAREGALDVDRAVSIVAQAAAALHAAHQAGVVHRDVKPANLLVTPTGTVKVTDFGIARAADAVSLTRVGMVMGTAHYLAPEQTDSRSPATPLTDVYALGVVLYECLAGQRPFPADNPVAVAVAQLREAPPPLPRHVPQALGQLVLRMLAKDPTHRPSSAGELARRLTALRAGSASEEGPTTPAAPLAGPDATPRLAVGSATDDTVVLESAAAEPATPFHRGWVAPVFSRALGIAVLAVVVLAAGSVWLLTAGLGPDTARVPPVEGRPIEQALTELAQQGFRADVRRQVHPKVPLGIVIRQEPNPGTLLPTDRPVLVVMSSGPPPSEIPGNNGQDQPGQDRRNQPGSHGNGNDD